MRILCYVILAAVFVAGAAHADEFVWAGSIGSPDSSTWHEETGRSVVVDGAGNVYIAGGFFWSDVDFDPGPGAATMTSAHARCTLPGLRSWSSAPQRGHSCVPSADSLPHPWQRTTKAEHRFFCLY